MFRREHGLGADGQARETASDIELCRRQSETVSGSREDSILLLPFLEALIGGREEEVSASLVNAYLHGHPLAALFDGPLEQVISRVGYLWYEGRLSVAQEHVATRTVLSALQTLRCLIRAPKEEEVTAICCGVEDDFHEVPVHLSQVLLEGEEWLVLNLGPNNPTFALTKATLQRSPKLVCVSSTILRNMDCAVREYKEFHTITRRAGIAVALGGTGFANASLRQRFPADLHADSFQQLSEFAAGIVSGSYLKQIAVN